MALGFRFVHSAVGGQPLSPDFVYTSLDGAGMVEWHGRSARHANRSGIARARPPAHPAQRCQINKRKGWSEALWVWASRSSTVLPSHRGGMELGSHFVHNAVDVSHWPPTLSKLLLWGWGIEERQCGSPRHAYRSGISHAGPPAHPAQRCQMTSSILPPHTALHVARAPVGAPPQAPRTMPVTRFLVQGMIPDGHMQANSKQHPRTNRSPKIYTSSCCLEIKMTFYRKALLLPFFST